MNNLNDSEDVGDQNVSTTIWLGVRHFRSWQKWLGLLWLSVLGVSIVLLGVVAWNNRETLLATLKTARYGYFLFTFASYVAANAAMTIGWHTGMRAFGVVSGLLTDFKIYFYTLAAKRVPGTLWYVAGRAVLYQRLGVPKRITSIVSGVEVMVSLVSGLLVGFPALLTYLNPSAGAILISVGGILVCLIFLHPFVMSRILGRLMVRAPLKNLRYRSMLIWAFWCCVMWVFGGLMMCSIILALFDLDIAYVPLVITSWALAGTISFAAFFLPHNFGITEITLSFMLSRFIPLPVAIATALISRILTTIFDIMFSSIFLLDRNGIPSNEIH